MLKTLFYNDDMKKNMSKQNNERQSATKLAFLFVIIPVFVVILMVVFWIVFQQTRKQVEIKQQQLSIVQPLIKSAQSITTSRLES